MTSWVEAQVRNRRQHSEADGDDRHGETGAHREAVHQPAVAIAVIAGAVGL
jgi:hypothetical protein